MSRLIVLAALLMTALPLQAEAATRQDAAATASAGEAPAGPWRQVIRFQPREGRDAGISLWVDEAAIVPDGAEPPMRTRAAREAWELWINHGAAVLGEQRYRIVRTRHHCGEGDFVMLAAAAYREDGTRLVAAAGVGERVPVLPHSAESELRRAICDDGTLARRQRAAATVAEALRADPAAAEPAAAQEMLDHDLDGDGRPEQIKIDILPPTMRVDIAVRGGRGPAESSAIVAERRPTSLHFDSRLRAVPPGTYLYACERRDGRDLEPCVAGAARLVRGGVELVTPGQPSLLLWLAGDGPRLARLPELPPVELPFPMPNTHRDRPLAPARGIYYPGRLGEACDSGALADGRRYLDRTYELSAGQEIGIGLASPDFAPTLQLLRRGRPAEPLLVLTAAGDGRRATARFTVPETGDYVVRLVAPAGTTEGRWRSELSFDRPLEELYPNDTFDWSNHPAVCR